VKRLRFSYPHRTTVQPLRIDVSFGAELFMDQPVPRHLIALGEEVVANVGRELLSGSRIVHMQLIASRLYEAIKDELDTTPRHLAARVHVLAAAAEQCRRAAQNSVSAHLMLVELRAAVAMLNGEVLCAGRPTVGRPKLRVIRGGRA
jgi:hypothetical protein